MEDAKPFHVWPVHALIIAAIGFFVLGILAPVASDRPMAWQRTTARTTAASLITSIEAFLFDYQRRPGDRKDGCYETTAANARLLNILRGKAADQNPRKLEYFDARDAKHRVSWLGKEQWSNGLDPRNGALLDPWGNPYRVRIVVDDQGPLASPYTDAPLPPGTEVIVWSLGEDGRQGSAADPRRCQGSDDVISWLY